MRESTMADPLSQPEAEISHESLGLAPHQKNDCQFDDALSVPNSISSNHGNRTEVSSLESNHQSANEPGSLLVNRDQGNDIRMKDIQSLFPLEESEAFESLDAPLLDPLLYHQRNFNQVGNPMHHYKKIMFGASLAVIVLYVSVSLLATGSNEERSHQPPPMNRFQRVESCARTLVMDMDCITKQNYDVRCKALTWFHDGSAGSLVDLVDNTCSWESEFGLLFSLIILRESLGIQDASWYSDRPVKDLIDVCRWKRITCDHNTTRITKLSLTHANLDGWLPNEVFGLKGLETLMLFSNPSLSGTIPTQLGLLSSLEQVELHESTLTGTIPTEFGRLSKLQTLRLHRTHLKGEMPAKVCSLTTLKTLEAACGGPSPMVVCHCCTKCKQ